MILEHVIKEKESGKKVIHILKNSLNLSSKLIKKLKRHEGSLLLNNIPVYTNKIVNIGDILKITIDFDETSENVIPEAIELDIIYEDDLIIALNKPPHIVMHPTYNYPTGTLANGLAYYYKSKGENILIRPVSRLDKDTSGVVLFAKNQFVQNYLTGQTNLEERKLTKEYLGIVAGKFEHPVGDIDLPIKRKEGSTIERIVAPDGQYSLTKYEVLKSYTIKDFPNTISLVKFKLITGRTHQIRVHCMYSGHPLIGETLYNKDRQGNILNLSLNGLIDRQCLHSSCITFKHPFTNEDVNVTAELTQDLKNVLNYLSINSL